MKREKLKFFTKSTTISIMLFLCFTLGSLLAQKPATPSQQKHTFSENDNFEVLSGKNFLFWKKIEASSDKYALMKMYKENYEKLFSQPVSLQDYHIPPTIHVIWLGPKNFPLESIACVRSWIALHPGWKIKFWTDRERPTPCRGMETILISDDYLEEMKECYKSTGNWAEKSDYLRYIILKKEGGVYVDHDAECMHSFDPFHRSYDFYAALGSFADVNINVPNGLVGTIPNHPIIEKTIKLILEKRTCMEALSCEKENEMSKTLFLSYSTLTEAVEKVLPTSPLRNMIFPTAYFWGFTGIREKPALYIDHYYANTWLKKDPASSIEKINYRKEKSMYSFTQMAIIIQASLLSGILGGLYLLYKRKR